MASLVTYRGGHLLKLRLLTPKLHEPPPKRGEVSEFTESSRRRFLQTLAALRMDEAPLFITLTYPDSFPSYREEFKRHLEVFWLRLRRRWPKASALWKLEFKERKSGENKGKVAPHYHLVLYGVPASFPFRPEKRPGYSLEQISPPGSPEERFWITWVYGEEPNVIAAGGRQLGPFTPEKQTNDTGEVVWGTDSLKHWISRNWYDVVGSRNPRHFRAGTKVEVVRSFRQLCGYAAKRYLSKKEFMPHLEHKPGRFWGVMGRADAPFATPEEVQLTEGQAIQLRRFFRRYRQAITPPEKRKRLRFGMADSREFSVSLFANADFWRARLWALVGDQPDAYELPEHTSALAGLLHSMSENGSRFRCYRLRSDAAFSLSRLTPSVAGASWMSASHPEP